MKSLQERVQRILKEEVAMVPYDARWPDRFRQEEQHLRTVLPHELVGASSTTAAPPLPACLQNRSWTYTRGKSEFIAEVMAKLNPA